MKKVTLQINGLTGEESASRVSGALNDLSGVVAADVSLKEKKASAYAGDRLSNDVIVGAVQNLGYGASVVYENYLQDVNEFTNSLR